MKRAVEPLINDDYTGEPPAKRLLAYLQGQREREAKIVGVYCGYAPVELIRAFGLVPASLCAFSNATIEAAEAVLPANLCPLIKSSYGFIMKDACPFFAISDAVVDVVLHACHSYNIESVKVGENVRDKHGLPFLKIVTDYSQSDVGQIRTRVEALMEVCKS